MNSFQTRTSANSSQAPAVVAGRGRKFSRLIQHTVGRGLLLGILSEVAAALPERANIRDTDYLMRRLPPPAETKLARVSTVHPAFCSLDEDVRAAARYHAGMYVVVPDFFPDECFLGVGSVTQYACAVVGGLEYRFRARPADTPEEARARYRADYEAGAVDNGAGVLWAKTPAQMALEHMLMAAGVRDPAGRWRERLRFVEATAGGPGEEPEAVFEVVSAAGVRETLCLRAEELRELLARKRGRSMKTTEETKAMKALRRKLRRWNRVEAARPAVVFDLSLDPDHIYPHAIAAVRHARGRDAVVTGTKDEERFVRFLLELAGKSCVRVEARGSARRAEELALSA